MSLPPIAITDSKVLGHETLHLFGMVDRYAILPPALTPTGKQENVPLRDENLLGKRSDPLGDAEGKILDEDLGFVLDEFGVYQQANFTPTASTEGMNLNEVLAELKKVEEIIKLGRDPNSMIRERKDFNDKIGKTAEDLD